MDDSSIKDNSATIAHGVSPRPRSLGELRVGLQLQPSAPRATPRSSYQQTRPQDQRSANQPFMSTSFNTPSPAMSKAPQRPPNQMRARGPDLTTMRPPPTPFVLSSSSEVPRTPRRPPGQMNAKGPDLTTMRPPPTPFVLSSSSEVPRTPRRPSGQMSARGPVVAFSPAQSPSGIRPSPSISRTPQHHIDRLHVLRAEANKARAPKPEPKPNLFSKYISCEPTINPQVLLTVKSSDVDPPSSPDTLRNPGMFYFVTSHYYSPSWVSYHLPTSKLVGSGILEHHTWYLNIDGIPTITESWLPAGGSNLPRVAQYSRGGRSVQGLIFRLSRADMEVLHCRPEVQSGDLIKDKKTVRIIKATQARDHGKKLEVIIYTPVRETRPMKQPLDRYERHLWIEGVKEAIFHRCISAVWAAEAIQPWLKTTLPE